MSDSKLLILTGWRVGFQKVEFTKMQQKELGFDLARAKAITDRLLEQNGKVILHIPSEDSERIKALSRQLGALVEESEVVCR